MRVQGPRTDVLPLTWEPAAGIALTWVLAAVLALPMGQGLAYLLVGQGFAWPGPKLGQSVLGLLSGEPGRGLPSPMAGDPPPTPVVYGGVALAELAIAGVAVWGLAWWWRTAGPAAQFGLAGRHEVEAVLGRRALRRRRATLRPDLGVGSPRPPLDRAGP
jgi:hypothetical protein